MASPPAGGDTAKAAVVCVFCASSSGNNPAHLESARTLANFMHAANISLVYGGGTRGIMGELARTLVSLSGPRSVHGVIPRALISIDPVYEAGSKAADRSSDLTSQSAPTRVFEGSGDGETSLKPAEREMSMAEMAQQKEAPSDAVTPGEYGITTIVPDMHTRKRTMASLVLDGGPGSGFVALAGGYGTIEEVMEMVTWNQLGIHRVPVVLVNIAGYWDGLVQWVSKAVEEGYVGEANKGILVEVANTDEVVGALKGYKVAEGRYQLNWG